MQLEFKNKLVDVLGQMGMEKSAGLQVTHREQSNTVALQSLTHTADAYHLGNAMVSIPTNPAVLGRLITELQRILDKTRPK